MAEDGGGWSRTWSEVRFGKVVKRPSSMAVYHVENAAWTKAIQSVMVLTGRTKLAEQVGLAIGGAAVLVTCEAVSAW
jgi:hypothetical protein